MGFLALRRYQKIKSSAHNKINSVSYLGLPPSCWIYGACHGCGDNDIALVYDCLIIEIVELSPDYALGFRLEGNAIRLGRWRSSNSGVNLDVQWIVTQRQ